MPGHDVLSFQGARLESELYPQVNRGCSDVAAESRSAPGACSKQTCSEINLFQYEEVSPCRPVIIQGKPLKLAAPRGFVNIQAVAPALFEEYRRAQHVLALYIDSCIWGEPVSLPQSFWILS